jgi:hypothetical protein
MFALYLNNTVALIRQLYHVIAYSHPRGTHQSRGQDMGYANDLLLHGTTIRDESSLDKCRLSPPSSLFSMEYYRDVLLSALPKSGDLS